MSRSSGYTMTVPAQSVSWQLSRFSDVYFALSLLTFPGLLLIRLHGRKHSLKGTRRGEFWSNEMLQRTASFSLDASCWFILHVLMSHCCQMPPNAANTASGSMRDHFASPERQTRRRVIWHHDQNLSAALTALTSFASAAIEPQVISSAHLQSLCLEVSRFRAILNMCQKGDRLPCPEMKAIICVKKLPDYLHVHVCVCANGWASDCHFHPHDSIMLPERLQYIGVLLLWSINRIDDLWINSP